MNKNYENFTIKLALVDAIPVIFFLLNTLCIQTIFKSYLFCLEHLFVFYQDVVRYYGKF